MDPWEYMPAPRRQPPPLPLLLPAVAAIVGILVARAVGGTCPPLTLVSLIALAPIWLAVVILLRRCAPGDQRHKARTLRLATDIAIAGFAVLGFVRYRLVCFHFPADHVLHYAAATDRLATVRATIVTPPRLTQPFAQNAGISFPGPATIATVECTEILAPDGWRPVSGRARLLLQAPPASLDIGQQIQCHARLACHLNPPANPGQPDRRDYYRVRRELVTFYVDHPQAVQVLAMDDGLTAQFRRFRAACQDRAWTLLRAGEPVPDCHGSSADRPGANLLAALLLGRRDHLPDQLADDFLATGAFHYLSVSGFHVGLLVSFSWGLGRLCGFRRRLQGLFALAVVLVYLIIVPDQPPVLRAGIVAIVFSVAYTCRRPVVSINLLALAALVTLLWRPLDIFNAGFQLSYAVTLGILLLVRAAHDSLCKEDDPLARLSARPVGPVRFSLQRQAFHWLSAAGRYLLGLAVLCTIAWLVGLPLAAWHFHRLSPWGPIVSIILLPAISLLLFAGFGKLIIGLIVPSTAAWLFDPLVALADLTAAAADALARLPFANINTAAPPLYLMVAFYAGLIATAWFLWHRRPLPRPLLLGQGFCLVLFVWLAPFSPSENDGLSVDVLSVGHGSACIIHWPDGHVACYDAGSLTYADVGRSTLAAALRTRGINHLDALFLSHPHPDHCNGAISLSQAVGISAVYVSPYFEHHAETSVRTILDEFRARNIPVRTLYSGQTLGWSGDHASVRVLWPPAGVDPSGLDANDASLVLRVTDGQSTALLTGDIGVVPQSILMEHASADLCADILAMPHHGSATATIADFVAAVAPSACLVSSSTPNPTTRSRLADAVAGREIYYTCDHGALFVTCGANNLRVHAFRPDPCSRLK